MGSGIEREYADAQAVAEMLGPPWNVQRVYRAARGGLLPHARVGRTVVFNLERLREHLAAGGSPLPGDPGTPGTPGTLEAE